MCSNLIKNGKGKNLALKSLDESKEKELGDPNILQNTKKKVPEYSARNLLRKSK